MNEKLVQYRENAARYWNQYNKTQKIMLVSSLLFIILVIALLSYQFSKTEYELAFQDLNATDAAAITNYLETSGISYELSQDGKSIGVPSTVAAKVKVEAGSQGLVQNGSLGFGVFSKESSAFGTTDNEFKVKYKDALNGEIQRLLNGMTGVSSSDVLVSLPEENVFVSTDDEDQASASIVLQFKSGYRPNQEAIDGYFNLVKTAVPKLSIDNITISGPDGELVPTTKGGTGGTAGNVIDQQFQVQKKFEDTIRKKVFDVLGTIMGKDKVVVGVFSSLNFDKKNTQEQLVTPVDPVDKKGIEISVERIQESYTGEPAQSGGVTGTGQSDVPGYPGSDSSGKTSSEKNSERINLEVNRITNQIVSSPYNVKDLTINVGVEPPNSDPNSLTPEIRNSIQTILINVVRATLADSGQTLTDEELIKKVSVFARPFDGKVSTQASSSIPNWVWYGAGILALALIGGTVLVMSRRRKPEIVEEEELPAKVEFPTIDIDNVNESQVRKQLETLAKKKPEEFVNLLRTWLVDE